jgi:hypothetical protein
MRKKRDAGDLITMILFVGFLSYGIHLTLSNL